MAAASVESLLESVLQILRQCRGFVIRGDEKEMARWSQAELGGRGCHPGERVRWASGRSLAGGLPGKARLRFKGRPQQNSVGVTALDRECRTDYEKVFVRRTTL